MPVRKRRKLIAQRRKKWYQKDPSPLLDHTDEFFKSCFEQSGNTCEDAHQTINAFTDSDGFCADEFFVVLVDKAYQYHDHDDLDIFVSSEKHRIYSRLKEECRNVDLKQFTLIRGSQDLSFVQFYERHIPKLKLSVIVDSDFYVRVAVHDKLLPGKHTLWDCVPRMCTNVVSIEKLLNAVAKFSVCGGNQDPDLLNFVPVGAYLDLKDGPSRQGYRDCYLDSTIRSTSCKLLVDGSRCSCCKVYRRTLQVLLKRSNSQPEKGSTPKKNWLTSKVANNKLTDSQKFEKLKQLRIYTSDLLKENEKLKRQINQLISKQGVQLSKEDSADLFSVMNSSENEIEKSYPDANSYQRLFWKEQLKYNRLQDKRGMRWHPMVIRWCIFLKSKSANTYDALKNSGFVKLPSERTLFDYTNFIQRGVGFQTDIVAMLHKELYKNEKLQDHQKIVGLLHDEIRIKSDLVYDKHSGELIDFVDLGGMNNDLFPT